METWKYLRKLFLFNFLPSGPRSKWSWIWIRIIMYANPKRWHKAFFSFTFAMINKTLFRYNLKKIWFGASFGQKKVGSGTATQYWEYGSGSTKLLNTDPMRIRIHNTGFVSGCPVSAESPFSNLKMRFWKCHPGFWHNFSWMSSSSGWPKYFTQYSTVQ